MGIEDLVASRWSIIPGRRTVSLYSSTASGFGGQIVVNDAEYRPLNKGMPPADHQAYLKIERRTWKLWKDKVGTTVPKSHDKIVDHEGTTWMVDSVDVMLLGQVYHCSCTKGR